MEGSIKLKNIFHDGAISTQFIAECITRHSTKRNIGGHSIFLGQVRADVHEDKVVSAIDYTSHIEMALEIMHGIREDIFSKYDVTCMHVYHSLGEVQSGDICLFVFTSSKHRESAMQSCKELVERIKSELPIWGKEIFSDLSHQWKVNT
jgi:molybdopterin synthase catalytic subunit